MKEKQAMFKEDEHGEFTTILFMGSDSDWQWLGENVHPHDPKLLT